MDEQGQEAPKSAGTETPPHETSAPPAWRARLKKWSIIVGISAVVAPVLILVLWTFVTLNYTYSTGYRAGFVQKISRKGWICPTWEGELQLVNLPGAAPEKWTFSVRDDLVATAVQASIGKSVALEYEEHRGVPTSCFGETAYYIVGVKQTAGK